MKPLSPQNTDRHEGELSAISTDWAASADLTRRKALGQYMTPRTVRDQLLDQLPLWPGIRVLDPGVGSGEFLRSVLDREPTAQVVGWDVDPEILQSAARLVPEADLEERSALTPYTGEHFDLVIGNPPYFQFKAPIEIKRQFGQVISGRPNIFALFFQAGMDVVKPGGRLAYVVPPSMNNGAYFEALREYIVSRAEIEYLSVLDGSGLFTDANTAVQLIVIRSGSPSRSFTFARVAEDVGFRRTIFAVDPAALESQFRGRQSLWELGYSAATGTVVWNQNREKLRREPCDGAVPLIWAHNIRGGHVELDPEHPKRPQYVVTNDALCGPAVVVNRIVGSVGSADLRCAPVAPGDQFVGENHVNVIAARPEVEQRTSWAQLLEMLQSPQIVERVRLLTGNTQVSASELNHLIPLG